MRKKSLNFKLPADSILKLGLIKQLSSEKSPRHLDSFLSDDVLMHKRHLNDKDEIKWTTISIKKSIQMSSSFGTRQDETAENIIMNQTALASVPLAFEKSKSANTQFKNASKNIFIKRPKTGPLILEPKTSGIIKQVETLGCNVDSEADEAIVEVQKI